MPDAGPAKQKESGIDRLRARLAWLYTGRGPVPEAFRYGLLAFDLLTVGFFIFDSLNPPMPSMIYLDLGIASLLIADFCARLFTARRRWRYLFDWVTIADMIVISTLLLPLLFENWAFLRVLRALRLLRSYRLLRDLRMRFPIVGRNQHVIVAIVDLIVFVFIITAIVFVTQHTHNPKIATYTDALYFTVTTLTTTGFGDIVLEGQHGRLIVVGIMLLGFALFIRLIQALFRPRKVHFRCPDCGLTRHDPDAVHCKHCGRVIHIVDEGYMGF